MFIPIDWLRFQISLTAQVFSICEYSNGGSGSDGGRGGYLQEIFHNDIYW